MPRPETVRAAVFLGAGTPLLLQDFPLPELKAGEILIRVTCCTICGSDLHTYVGRRQSPTPSVLGHEILGRIADFGPDAPRHDVSGAPLHEGDRVTWSVAVSCGQCFCCRHQLPQKCETLFKYGHEPLSRSALSGGLAEYCVLRPGTALVRVPEELDNRLACPASCSTATVAAALRAGYGCGDQTVLLLGAGVLGLSACAMARGHGARAVICCDIDPDRAERARAFGATHCCLADESALRPVVEAVTEGRGADLVVELSGSANAVELGAQLVRIGGILVLVGTVFPTRAVSLDPERIVRRLLTIRGVHNYAPDDLLTAMQFLAGQRDSFVFQQLVSATFPLEQADEAFQHALRHPGTRVAVQP